MMNIRYEDQTLFFWDLYNKMSVNFVLEGVKFLLQLSRFFLLRVHKDVLYWSQLISYEHISMD